MPKEYTRDHNGVIYPSRENMRLALQRMGLEVYLPRDSTTVHARVTHPGGVVEFKLDSRWAEYNIQWTMEEDQQIWMPFERFSFMLYALALENERTHKPRTPPMN